MITNCSHGVALTYYKYTKNLIEFTSQAKCKSVNSTETCLFITMAEWCD